MSLFPIFCPGNSTPAAFAFTNQNSLGAGAVATSNAVTPTGYDSPALVTATNGAEFSIDGGTWSSLARTINPGQTLRVRMAAASTWATDKSTVVSIDGRSATWTLTTGTVTPGSWDTGWTAGSWAFTTPAFFNWLQVQLWAPGGGGGGGCGEWFGNGNGGDGGDAGTAQFAGGPYATGGGRGTGGVYQTQGYTTSHGSGFNGDENTYAGGSAGGRGGYGAGVVTPGISGFNGGPGGTGGYVRKTYNWGQITPSAAHGVVLGNPGAGGAAGAWGPTPGYNASEPGDSGSYGRCYINWG